MITLDRTANSFQYFLFNLFLFDIGRFNILGYMAIYKKQKHIMNHIQVNPPKDPEENL